MVAKCLGVKITGVAKCLGCKISRCQNVLIWGGTMSGWQNVLLSKCLGVKKLGVKYSGVKISGEEMSENPNMLVTLFMELSLEVGNCPFLSQWLSKLK